MLSDLIKPFLIFNIFLFLSFSISVNSFDISQNINTLFYIFFHIVFIYCLFYKYHFSIFIIAFTYGILFDIFLLNNLGPHLLSFITLIVIFNLFKKYFFLLSSNQISITIFINLIIILYFEFGIAYLLNYINFDFLQLIKYLIISILIFVPSVIILNKIDK